MDNIKSPEDILLFLDNIEYGYIDIFNNMHVNSLDGFRKNYRSMSIEEVLEYKLGTCIERNLVAILLTLDDGSRLKKLFSKICRKTLTN